MIPESFQEFTGDADDARMLHDSMRAIRDHLGASGLTDVVRLPGSDDASQHPSHDDASASGPGTAQPAGAELIHEPDPELTRGLDDVLAGRISVHELGDVPAFQELAQTGMRAFEAEWGELSPEERAAAMDAGPAGPGPTYGGGG